MPDLIADGRRLLGTVDWQRTDWLDNYYPPDLPSSWRLAYYANDCDCVLLPPDRWCGVAGGPLAEVLDETPDRLSLFLRVPAGTRPSECDNLGLFADRRVVLLTDTPDPAFSDHPQWLAQGDGRWADADSAAGLACWSFDRWDLREARVRAEGMADTTRALVLDGAAANPARVGELRTLLELMDRA